MCTLHEGNHKHLHFNGMLMWQDHAALLCSPSITSGHAIFQWDPVVRPPLSYYELIL